MLPINISVTLHFYTLVWVVEVIRTPPVESQVMSNMTERPKWWRAFLPKWKTTATKDTTSGPDIERQKEAPAAGAKTTTGLTESQHDSYNGPDVFPDDTFDDSNLESVFNEQTSLRKIRISRSGRFKHKQNMRTTLPTPVNETENVAPEKEDTRWQ